MPKKWGNMRSIFLKTPDSVALPVWQTVPEGSKKTIDSAPAAALPVTEKEVKPSGDKTQGKGSKVKVNKPADKNIGLKVAKGKK